MENGNVGAVLLELRRRRGVRQFDVCKATGLWPSELSRYENGTRVPRLGKLAALADYYGVSLDVLTGREPADK